MRIGVHIERWPAIRPFRIAGKVWNSFDSIVVELSTDGFVGRGEALGVFYLDETPDSLLAQVDQVSNRIRAGIDRASLQTLLPPGGARNAIDCALWDLEAKSTGRSIWDLTAVVPKEVETVFTIGIEHSPRVWRWRRGSA